MLQIAAASVARWARTVLDLARRRRLDSVGCRQSAPTWDRDEKRGASSGRAIDSPLKCDNAV